jgi:hypothetical protein
MSIRAEFRAQSELMTMIVPVERADWVASVGLYPRFDGQVNS